MPFAAFDLFACIVAALAGDLGRLDALAVQTTGSRMFMPACLPAYLGAQGIVQALPVTAVTPLPKVMIDAFPLGVLSGQSPPLDAAHHHIEDGVKDQAHLQAPWPPARFGGRNQLFDKLPLVVSEIGWVLWFAHFLSLPNHADQLSTLFRQLLKSKGVIPMKPGP